MSPPLGAGCPWLVLRLEIGTPEGDRSAAQLGVADVTEELVHALVTVGSEQPVHRGQVPVATPEMEIRYEAAEASTFWRD